MSFYKPSKGLSIPSFFVLTLLFAFLGLSARAQVKSKRLLLPPKIVKPVYESEKPASDSAPILKLIEKAAQEAPLAFAWQLNADTLVKAKDLFREIIEFDGGATVRKAMAIDTVRIKKTAEAGADVRQNFLSFSTSLAAYDISQQKGKPILVLANTRSDEKLYFKVFLDKAAKKILKIQNLSNGRFYFSVPFEGPTISL
jgi:hypothetical protein